MSNREMSSSWTPNKVSRLKQLVLRHVSNGGTVRDACEQFEFETNGIHKTRSNQLKWVLSIRSTCREEFKVALEQGRVTKMQKFGEQSATDEPLDDEIPSMDDELSDRLFSTVLEMVEDRRQLSASVDEFQQQRNRNEAAIQELEDAHRLDQMRFEKKDKEIEGLAAQVQESESNFKQLQEDYELLRSNTSNEYYRLQLQFKESKMQYDNLHSEFRKYQAASRREVDNLESQLRESQSRYEQLLAQYELSRQDNARLTKRITDFAQQITSIVPSESSRAQSISPIPIRSSVTSSDGAGEEADRGSASI